MAFNCRLFGHRGLEQMVHRDRQFTSDTVFNLMQPYEWSQVLSVASVAVSSLAIADVNASAGVNVLRIEVPDGFSIRYEINPPGRAVAAGNLSPVMLSGVEHFYFRGGFTVSLIDAAGLP